MHRRLFLGSLGAASGLGTSPVWGQPPSPQPRATADRLPRKVIVGTVVKRFWGEYPGLEERLEELTGIVSRMAGASRQSYGRRIDIAILPETAVSGEAGNRAWDQAIPLEGRLQECFARAAKEHGCYLVVPTYLREGGLCFNAGILFDRTGRVAGIYRKVHLAVPAGSDSMEAGTTPGKQFPVFDCDFGKLGIQICFDIEFDDGWNELARQGAELVAWPTQSPQTSHPAFRAHIHRNFIVSSNWRHNSSVFEPTGKIPAQVTGDGDVLAYELDLSFAILPWSSRLDNGKALQEKYGSRVGFHYYEDEDCGLFWSNDRAITIGEMARSIGVTEMNAELERIRGLYRAAGVPGV